MNAALNERTYNRIVRAVGWDPASIGGKLSYEVTKYSPRRARYEDNARLYADLVRMAQFAPERSRLFIDGAALVGKEEARKLTIVYDPETLGQGRYWCSVASSQLKKNPPFIATSIGLEIIAVHRELVIVGGVEDSMAGRTAIVPQAPVYHVLRVRDTR